MHCFSLRHGILESLESRIAPATVTAHWTGGSGDWTDPTHWDIGVVPDNVLGTDYNVVLDAGGTPTITLTSSITVHSLVAHNALLVDGGTLTLDGGVSTSDATFALRRGSFAVTGGAATFTATGPTEIDMSSLYAVAGGKLTLANATSFDSGADGYSSSVVFRAEGAGSVLDLHGLTSITNGRDFADHLSIQAATGGKVDLSHVTTLLDPNQGNQDGRSIDVSSEGVSSVVDLTALTSFQDLNNQTISHLSPTDHGVITAPMLASVRGVAVAVGSTGGLTTSALVTALDSTLTLTGGSFAFPALKTAIGTSLSLNSPDTLGLGELLDLTRGALSLSGGATASVPKLSTISSASFYVSGGVTLALPMVTGYAPGSDGVVTGAVFHAEGLGTLLDLHTLTSLSNGTDFADHVSIEASAGGQIDLSNVSNLVDPAAGNQDGRGIDVTADGAGSVVYLFSVVNFHDLGNQTLSHLTATNGGVLATGALRSLRGVSVTMSGGGTIDTSGVMTVQDSAFAFNGLSVAFPALKSAIGSSFSLTGPGSLNLGELLDLTRGSLTLTGGATANVAKLAAINSASFSISGGTKLALPAATTYAPGGDAISEYAVFHAEGVGTVLDLHTLTSITNGTDFADHLVVEALAGAKIDLSRVTSLLDPNVGNQEGRGIDVTAEGVGSAVNFAALTSFADFSNQTVSHLTPSNGGVITAPALTSLRGVVVTQNANGGLSFAKLQNASASAFTLSNGTFAFPVLKTAVDTAFALSGGGQLNLGSLIDLTRGSLSLTGGATANVAKLADIDSASIFVSGGVKLSLPALRSYAPGTDGIAIQNTLRAEGAGTVLDLHSLTSITDGTDFADFLSIEAITGGKVDLSHLTTLTESDVGNQNNRAISVTAQGVNSLVDLTALTSFQDFSGQTASSLRLIDSGLINAPKLISIQNVSLSGYSNTFTVDSAHAVTFLDSHGTKVSVAMTGQGTATFHRTFDATLRGDLMDLDLVDTTPGTALKITTSGTAHTALPQLEVHSSIGTISMPGVDVTGHLTVNGTTATLVMGNLLGGADVTLSGQLLAGGTSVTVGTVAGTSDLTSASPLTTLQASTWLAGNISAPSIASLKVVGVAATLVPGDIGANVTVGGSLIIQPLPSVAISGSIVSGTWTVTGDVGTITAANTAAAWTATVSGTVQKLAVTRDASLHVSATSIGTLSIGGNLTQSAITLSQAPVVSTPALKALGSFTVGGTVHATVLKSAGHLGLVTVGAIRNSSILAGITPGSTGLPDAANDFAMSATIDGFTVKGIAGAPFSFIDTIVAAKQLGTVVVRDVATDNAGVTFGLAANKIASFTSYQGTNVTKKLTNLTPASNPSSYQVGDFVVRAV